MENIGIIIGIIVAAVALVVLIAGLVFAIVIFNKKKKNLKGHVTVDKEFIDNILNLLGGKDNITSVSVDNARLKFLVEKLDSVDLVGLKAISSNGVFITGNVIKTLFKYESMDIKKEIDKLL